MVGILLLVPRMPTPTGAMVTYLLVILVTFIVYVERVYHDFCDLYQQRILGICNTLNHFTHLSYASGPKDDAINSSAKVLLMHINVIRFKASVMWEFLDGIKCLSLLK